MSPPPSRDPDARLFDQMYAASRGADARALPWTHGKPHPFLVTWLKHAAPPTPERHRALVIGCGLGDDAEALAASGWQVTAFDGSDAAIAWARERFPDSLVDYHVADLFALPEAWIGAFDLVVEIHTVQALPPTRRQHTIAQIASTARSDGTLFVVTFVRDVHAERRGRPWPLTEREVATFSDHGFVETDRFTSTSHPGRLNVIYRHLPERTMPNRQSPVTERQTPVHDSLDLIVSAEWLAAHRDEVVVVDVRPADQYGAGHIPGAHHIDLYPIKVRDSDPDQIDAWVAEVQSAFRQLGIAAGDRVVFYEDISGTTAARGVWLMPALSFGSGAMLDGGLAAWHGAGLPVDTAPVEVTPSTVAARLNPALFATANDVLDVVEGDGVVVDTRGDVEWTQGTIPTARHLEWIQHLNADGTMKTDDELRRLYQELDVRADHDIVTFCASGYRAAHTWLVLSHLGYRQVRNYAPSWGEWGRRADLPVAPTT